MKCKRGAALRVPGIDSGIGLLGSFDSNTDHNIGCGALRYQIHIPCSPLASATVLLWKMNKQSVNEA